MNYASIKECDSANGLGVRVSIFVSGCNHKCKGCFNEAIWDFNIGDEYTKEVENHILDLLKRPYIRGLSLLGGEPMEPAHQIALLSLVKRAKEMYPNKDIWCWTGFLFDKDIMQKMYKFLKQTPEFLKYIDVIVDGKFIEELKDLRLRFRGSSNQRIIDVKKSIEEDKVVEYSFLQYA